jgi:hypothetical protein
LTKSNLLGWSSKILFAIGALGFLGGFLFATAGNRFPIPSVEFPLGDVQDVAVDEDGNILLALGFYGRIQLYDSAGRFQRGWPADALGGSFTVAFRGANVVASYAARRHSTILFDLAGTRLNEEAEEAPPEHHGGASSISLSDGSTLRVQHGLLWPALVRHKDGVTSTVVTGPWYFRPITGPLPTWLLMLAGALLGKQGLRRILAKRRGAV